MAFVEVVEKVFCYHTQKVREQKNYISVKKTKYYLESSEPSLVVGRFIYNVFKWWVMRMNIATAQVALPIVVVVLLFEKATLPVGQLTNRVLVMPLCI